MTYGMMGCRTKTPDMALDSTHAHVQSLKEELDNRFIVPGKYQSQYTKAQS